MVERIRSLLAQFPEDEAAVRELAARDPSFDALCQEYRKVVDLLGNYEAHVKFLKERRAWLEEQLLTRMEGQPPQLSMLESAQHSSFSGRSTFCCCVG